MQLEIIKPTCALQKATNHDRDLSTNLSINYNKSSLKRHNNITTINIDKAISGKTIGANTKTYTQNLVKKYELTGNKEVCIRKIFISERPDNFFDITVRELNIYYRKNKKQNFNKVLKFKTQFGNIEHIFELLSNTKTQKTITVEQTYMLN
jgi:hypothetical protein